MKKRIGWKKVHFNLGGIQYGAIVKLQILGRVVRPYNKVNIEVNGQSQYVSKYRTSKARVLDIFPSARTVEQMRLDGKSVEDWDKIVFRAAYTYQYYNGKICVPHEKFDDDPYNDCSSGIHFFGRKCEAEAW